MKFASLRRLLPLVVVTAFSLAPLPASASVYDQLVVFVQNVQVIRPIGAGPAPGAAGAVHPQPHLVTGGERPGGIGGADFFVVDEDLAPFARRHGPRARAQPIRRRQKLVEPRARVAGADRPSAHGARLAAGLPTASPATWRQNLTSLPDTTVQV